MTGDIDYLRLALDEATRQAGGVAPNPRVGCVVVKGDNIIARGHHQGPGTWHAERMALSDCPVAVSRGATCYVTLEPCNHHGRTPPCVAILLEKKIARVVFAFFDPNPLMAGKSQTLLEQHGVLTAHVPLPEINAFYQAYAYWWQHKQPWVIAKLALTKNGKTAGKNGVPMAITDAPVNAYTHDMRLISDAILTTAATVLADNPALNARVGQEVRARPLYVLDRRARLTGRERIWQTAQHVTVFVGDSATYAQPLPENTTLCRLPAGADFSLTAVIDTIGAAGIHQLWVEAGASLFGQLAEKKLANQLLVYESAIDSEQENQPHFSCQRLFQDPAYDVKCGKISGSDCKIYTLSLHNFLS